MTFIRFDLGSVNFKEEIAHDLEQSQNFLRINHYFYKSVQ